MSGSVLKTIASLFTMSDEQAMWRVKMNTDTQAFGQLVSRWERPIQALCTRMTGDVHRAQDLAQETFVRLFTKRESYEPSGKFSTFIWRVALNLCHDELRRLNRRREMLLEDDALAEEMEDSPMNASPPPDIRLLENERAEAVRRALLKLGEPYRTVVVLRHYEGLKFREIGEVLAVPEGTVKSRMAEAMTQLNTLLSRTLKEGDTPCKTPTPTPKETLVL
jgi:RNA polymerase sigma-70 factor (ECF subfamily)